MTGSTPDAPPAAVIDGLARILARVLVDAIRREDDAAAAPPAIRTPAPNRTRPPRKRRCARATATPPAAE